MALTVSPLSSFTPAHLEIGPARTSMPPGRLPALTDQILRSRPAEEEFEEAERQQIGHVLLPGGAQRSRFRKVYNIRGSRPGAEV